MRKRLLLLVVLLLCLPAVGFSQVADLSLDDAVGMALDQNYNLRSKQHALNARRWGFRNAVTQFFPRVTFNAVYSKVDETTNAIQNAPIEFFRQFVPDMTLIPRESYSSDLSVSQPIYNGGSLWANLSVARNSRKASEQDLQDARLGTILEAKRAFFDVLMAEDMLDIQTRSVALAEEYLSSARLQLSLGMISNVDALRWELQLANNKAGLVEAENMLDLSRTSLLRAIGAGVEDEFHLVHLTDEEIASAVESAQRSLGDDFKTAFHNWKSMALDNSPSMKAVRSTTAINRALYRQKYSLFQPSLNFNYTYSWETDDDINLDGLETWRASVVLSFPLFSSLGDYTSLKEAREDLKSSEAAEKDFEQALMLQVSAVASNLKASLQRIEVARISSELSRENLKAVENKYRLGLMDNLNLIDAQVSNTAAEAEYVSAVYYFLITRAELDRLLGRESLR